MNVCVILTYILGVGGLSLSLGRAGEGGGGSRGGGHLSRRILLLERPFFPRFLHTHNAQHVFSDSSRISVSNTIKIQNIKSVKSLMTQNWYSASEYNVIMWWIVSAWQQEDPVAFGVVYSYIMICFWFCSYSATPLGGDILKTKCTLTLILLWFAPFYIQKKAFNFLLD